MISNEEKLWVLYRDETYFGPLSATEIKTGLMSDRIHSNSPIWKKGWSKWKIVKAIPLFKLESSKAKELLDIVLDDLPIPKIEDFTFKIDPKVSSSDLSTMSVWDGKRVAIVSGSFLLAGPLGGLAAGVLTRRGKAIKVELEENKQYISDKNK